jgi:hypothetical protein
MHSRHYDGAVFPNQALGRRTAQEALIQCTGLHKNIFECEISSSHCGEYEV